jgi:hypothetical protein
MGVSTSNIDKAHQMLIQDDVLLKVGRNWANTANTAVKYSAIYWPQVSQIARKYVPFSYSSGTH